MAIKVYDLCCGAGHVFEGWFSSEADYTEQKERGLLTCPMCGSPDVTKRPSAGYVQGDAARVREEARRRVMAYVRDVASRAEDVGEQFVREARGIREGRSPQRAIRGQCTMREAEALIREGIAVLPIPESTGKTLN